MDKHPLLKRFLTLGEELVDAIDEDGETLLHLAPINLRGKTELDVLDESPRGTTNSYLEIRRILLRLLPPSFGSVLPKLSDTTMVVVVLVATMAYQNAVNPPGGVWQDDTSSHKAGDVVIAYTHPHIYKYLVYSNTIAFVSSIVTILLITTGETSRNLWLLKIALKAMWVSMIAIAVSYGASVMVIAPNMKTKLVDLVVKLVILVSLIIAVIISSSVLIVMSYFEWKRKMRHQEDITAEFPPKRILYQIFQRLDTNC